MARRFLQFMDDMHLSSQNTFLDYYNSMQANNISGAVSILDNNPSAENQITNAGNVNILFNEVEARELRPKKDIDDYLNELNSIFNKMISNTKIVGTWNANTQYYSHNLVYYQNKGYFVYSVTEPPVGTLPTDTNYWLEYDIKGLKGYGGFTNLKYLGVWSNTITYNPQDVVVYQNKMWMANAQNTNYAPNLNHYPWSLIMVPGVANKAAIQKTAPEGYGTGDFWFKITQGDDIIQTSWATRTPESVPRFSSGSFILGDNIYVVGGQNAALVVTNTNEAYDMTTNTWSTKANMPVAKDGFAAFAISGIGYCVGGLGANGLPSNDCYSYNPVSNSWTKISDFPFIMAYLGSVAVKGNNAYLGAILTASGISGDIYRFDANDESWTKITTMPIPRLASSVSIIDNKLYFIGGGEIIEIPYGDTQIYDLTTNTWSTGVSMISPRMATGTFVHNDEIFVVGGLDELQYSTNLNQVYNVTTNTWRNDVPMTYGRNSLTSQYTQKKGYAIGGINIAQSNIAGYMEEYQFMIEESSFDMIISISTSNTAISIPMAQGGKYNYYIDWGDGTTSTQITTYNDSQATHTYTTVGEYTIKLIGSLDLLKFTGTIATCLKEVTKCNLAFSSITGMFLNCTNLVSIVDGIFDKSLSVTSASDCFNGCSSLKTIPVGLFDNNSQLQYFSGTFQGSGVVNIPNGLFNSNNLNTSFYRTFYNCRELTAIPSRLFDSNTLVTTFEECFRDCVLLSVIPDNLLINNPIVDNYRSMFRGCFRIHKIPANLCKTACSSATKFERMFEGVSLETDDAIPAGLFSSAVNAENYSYVFNTPAVTTIPDNCFNGKNAVWTSAFPIMNITTLGNNSLNGLNITSNMFMSEYNLKTVGNDAFWANDKLDIPSNPTQLLDGCYNLTSVGNINLMGVPNDVNLSDMFLGCNKLSNVSGFYYKDNIPSLGCTISFLDCPLTYESLINISNSLKTNPLDDIKELMLGSDNLAKLSTVEKLEITNKHWKLPGFSIDITPEIAQELVLALYGNDSMGTQMYQETSLYFYIRLYSKETSQDIDFYAVDKTTGYTYEYSNVPQSEYYIQITNDISAEVPVTNEYWLAKGEENDTSGTILKTRLADFNNPNVQSIVIGRPAETLKITNTGIDNVQDLSSLFKDFSSVKELSIEAIGNGKATNMASMFENCIALTSINLSKLNTSNCKDMRNMFHNCGKIKTWTFLKDFNTSNVLNMSHMFEGCDNLSYFPSLDMSSVTDASYMFRLTSITILPGNVIGDKLINAKGMFQQCSLLETLPSNYTTVFGHNNNLQDVSYLFASCRSLKNIGSHNVFKYEENSQGIGDWVIDDDRLNNQLFRYCPNITDMSHICNVCTVLGSDENNKGIPLGLFYHCPKVTDISFAFGGCKSLAVVTPGVIHCQVLFSKNLELKNISYLFNNAVIDGFLTENINNSGYVLFPSTKIEDASYLFNNCQMTSIVGNENIPFVYKSPVLKNISHIFSNQTCFRDLNNMFTGNYSWANMSTYCPALTDCSYMFSGDTELIGTGSNLVTALNKITTLENHEKVFENCSKLSDYSNIPSDWK